MDSTPCTNPDHTRPVPAIARLFWPDGRYNPSTACITDLTVQLRRSLEEGHAIEVWPVAKEPLHPLRFGKWRKAPDCDRCKDTGRFRETSEGITVEAQCGCKRGQRMSELWYAQKHGYGHPDEPEPEPPTDDEPPWWTANPSGIVGVPVTAGEQVLTTLMDASDAERLGGRKLSLGSHGYVQFAVDRHMTLLHRWILGLRTGDGRIGDHVNGDQLDNRRANLRAVSPRGSNENLRGFGRSGYRGVYQTRRWPMDGIGQVRWSAALPRHFPDKGRGRARGRF
jgi:hypothetical protein